MLTRQEKFDIIVRRMIGATYKELNARGYTNRQIADTMKVDTLCELIVELKNSEYRPESFWTLLVLFTIACSTIGIMIAYGV